MAVNAVRTAHVRALRQGAAEATRTLDAPAAMTESTGWLAYIPGIRKLSDEEWQAVLDKRADKYASCRARGLLPAASFQTAVLQPPMQCMTP